MPASIPNAADLTRLTPAQQRVAEVLVTGASNPEGARQLGMSHNTFARHMANIATKLGITGRDGRPARAHAVLAGGQVPPPPAPAEIPDLTREELRLLRARAEHPDIEGIARAAGIPPGEVRQRIRELVARAGACNDTHLIGLGHAWGLLTAVPREAGTTKTPGQPSGDAR